MQGRRHLASALLVLVPAAAIAQSEGGTIHLGVGQQKTLTVPDVQRVARKYFMPSHRNVFYVLPESMKKPASPATTGSSK